MSGNNNQTDLKEHKDSDEFPVAAIVCLAVVGYVILVIIILLIRQKLLARGSCQSNCCSPEDGTCYSLCQKANEACPCCCGANVDLCLSRLCGKRKKTQCIDILLCNCCGCTEGSCETCKCTDLMPQKVCGCDCGRETSVTCGPFCTLCCDDDLGPNTCGFLCLEVKLRSPRIGGGSLRRSSSAPVIGTQASQLNIHKVANGQHEKQYKTEEKGAEAISYPQRDGDAAVRQRSLSLNPTLSKAYNKGENSDWANITGSSDSARNTNLQLSARSNSHVNFDPSVANVNYHDNGEHFYSLTLATQMSSSLSDDSSKNLPTGALLGKIDKSTNTPEIQRKSYRTLQAGYKSQRFPNKILVSSESLASGTELMTSSGSDKTGYLSDSQSHSTLPHFNTHLNSRRPLPPLKKSVES